MSRQNTTAFFAKSGKSADKNDLGDKLLQGGNDGVQLEIKQNHVIVYVNDIVIGSMELYSNPYHTRNQYVKLNLEHFVYDTQISAEIFGKLFDSIGGPLQIMADSDNLPLTTFLTAGGFVCKRKCYEVEAEAENYIGTLRGGDILQTQKGEAEYDLCCKMLYERYAETHRAINPLTADFETFASDLPDDVFYQREGNLISCFAFVEKNEIAYVYGRDNGSFLPFAEILVSKLLNRYQTVCFEADDCDQTAKQLKTLFTDQSESSFDTYVYDGVIS